MQYTCLPYKDMGRTRDEGVDCFGLVKLFYQEEYSITLKDHDYEFTPEMVAAIEQETATDEWIDIDRSELRRGDVLVLRQFKEATHVGVCVDSRYFVHCEAKLGSCRDKIAGPRWNKRIISCHRHRLLADSNRAQAVVCAAVGNEKNIVDSYGGDTVKALVKRAVSDDTLNCAHVTIKGQTIAWKNWPTHIIQAGDIVTINIVPKGGSKNILRTVLSLGVMLISGGAIAGIDGGAFFANFFSTSAAVGVGISSMIGMLAINALIPPSEIELPDVAGTNSSTVYSINGTGNRMNKQGSIPFGCGTHRFYPPYAMKNYVSNVGDEQFLHCVFMLGYGNPTIAEEKIGETLLSSFDGVQEESGVTPNQPSSAIIPKNVSQDPLSVELTQEGGREVRTSELETTAIEIDIAAPQGFCRYNDDGNPVETKVLMEVDRRPTSGGSWVNCVGQHVSGLSVSNRGAGYDAGWHELEYIWSSTYKSQELPRTRVFVFGGMAMGFEVLESGNGLDHTPTFTMPASAGTPTTDAVFTTTMSDGWLFKDNSVDPKRWTISCELPSTGQYDIGPVRITADTPDSDTRTFNDLVWTGLSNIFSGLIIDVPYTAKWKAFKIKASGELNGTLQTYNAVLTYCGSLPPDAFQHVLTSEAMSTPILPAEIDSAQMTYWENFCTTNNLTFDAIFDDGQVLSQRLNAICAAGRATIDNSENLYSVIIDEPQTDSVTILTPRNTGEGFKGELSLIEQPHGLRAQFVNADNGYQIEDKVVYAPGYTSANATIIEEKFFFGIVHWAGVFHMATYHMNCGRYQREPFTFPVDAEQLRCTKGDRVTVYNSVNALGTGCGRITAISGSDVTLDESMTLDGSTLYEMVIRCDDKTVSVHELTAGQSGTISTFTMDTLPTGIKVKDLCVIVKQSDGPVECLITHIEPSTNQGASITVLPYSDDVYTIGSASTYTAPGSVNPNIIKAPRNVITSEYLYSENGTLLQGVTVSWEYPLDTIADYYDVQILRPNSNDWQIAGKTPGNTLRIENIPTGTYSIRVRSKLGVVTSEWVTVEDEAFTIFATPPPDVINLSTQYRNGVAVLVWSSVSDPRSIEYIVRYGTSWEAGIDISVQVSTEYTPTQDGQYFVKARAVQGGAVSENEAIITVTGLNQLTNVVKTVTEDWTGTLTGSCYRPPSLLARRWFGDVDGALPDTDIWRVDSGLTFDATKEAIKAPSGGPTTYTVGTGIKSKGSSKLTSTFDFSISASNANTTITQILYYIDGYGNPRKLEYEITTAGGFIFMGTGFMAYTSAILTAKAIIDMADNTFTVTLGTITYTGTVPGSGSGDLDVLYVSVLPYLNDVYIYNISCGPDFDAEQDYINCWSGISPILPAGSAIPYTENTKGYYTTPASNIVDLGHDDTVIGIINSLVFHGQDSRVDLNLVDWLAEDDLLLGASNKLKVQPQIRVKTDGGTWGEWVNFSNTSYTGRYFEVRLEITCDEFIVAYISEFIWSLDMKDRFDGGDSVAVLAAGTTIVYNTEFQEVQHPQITQVGAVSGDTIALTAETKTGFTVQILNGGVGKDGTINWFVKGY